jgi:hypothetical protein
MKDEVNGNEYKSRKNPLTAWQENLSEGERWHLSLGSVQIVTLEEFKANRERQNKDNDCPICYSIAQKLGLEE